MKNKKRGLTLIELIMVIGLMSIIISISFVFFISNNKRINEINIRTNLQSKAEICMKYISKNTMEATGGRFGNNELTDDYEVALNTISDEGVKNCDGIVFVFNRDSKSIVMKTKINETDYDEQVICTDVKDFTASYKNDNVICIKLSLEESGIDYSIEDSYVYRNKHLN